MIKKQDLLQLPEKNRLEIILSILFLAGVAICILIIAFGNLSGKEGAILSLFLTVLSVIASWLLAKMYGDSQHLKAIEEVKEMHNEKVRTFALKAAEKVNNLSEQINRLSIYLEEELNEDSYDDDKESLQAKEERIASAIHILSMLKSVNDTSLSDWHGVIDEEIEEQREAREEREEELRGLVHRLEALISKANQSQRDDGLAKQIDTMKKDMRLLMAGVSGAHVSTTKITKRKSRQDLIRECPHCRNELRYTQRAKRNSVKSIHCSSCSSLVYSRFSLELDDFILDVKEERQEHSNCPECETDIFFTLSTEAHTKRTTKCTDCGCNIIFSRRPSGGFLINGSVGKITSDSITEQDILNVKNELPAQPWPTGVHKVVSEKLGMSNAAVMKATRELIRRGVFKEQIDGVLYDLVPENKTPA
ncbi:hypothetical protein ACEVAQ_08525 [Ectopseudomonas khazarica]|uniref:Uncharacterized protein n=1 Tax=Ectopseudomonas khazarica TaxID=2502979 RepID=A0ABW7MBI2_9GAMM